MVDVIKAFDLNGEMVLQVNRLIYGKTWSFQLQIPQEYWEDLPYGNEEYGPQTVSAAYSCAGIFWDRLAKENADSLEQFAMPGASNRHIKKVRPDYRTLELEYTAPSREPVS